MRRIGIAPALSILMAAWSTVAQAAGPAGNRPPTASLTASPSSGYAPLDVTLDGSASSDPDGDPITWQLDFGDGQQTGGSGKPVPVTHTYGTGNWTATLFVSDAQGFVGQASVRITVQRNVPPTASLTASPASGDAPLATTLDGSGSSDPDDGIDTWTLAFGDGSPAQSGTGQPGAVPHTYSSPGTYTATLTVADTAGQQSSASTTVQVTQPPTTTSPTTTGSSTTTLPGTTTQPGTTTSEPTTSEPPTSEPPTTTQPGTTTTRRTTTTTTGETTTSTSTTQPETTRTVPPTSPPTKTTRAEGEREIAVDRPSAEPGGDIVVSGRGCRPNATVTISVDGRGASNTTAGPDGTFSEPLSLPSTEPGEVEVIAECGPTLVTTIEVVLASQVDPGTSTLVILLFFILLAASLLLRRGLV